MMAQTRSVAKRQKVEECTSCMESVLLNSDSLFKIASYLPADGLLDLALTCRRFGIAPISDGDGGGDDSLSLIEETARRIVQDIATEEEKNALSGYDEENWLSKYNYLQLPLTFDQLVPVGYVEYVEGNKSCVANRQGSRERAAAFSNNIMMAGKHYASFEVEVYHETGLRYGLLLGVMRPGDVSQSAYGNPLAPEFYRHFTEQNGSRQYNNTINCCMYSSVDHCCWSSAWEGNSDSVRCEWYGMEALSPPCTVGMLLDLDEGTLSVYKNGRKLGVMKRGLAGHYCWAVSLAGGTQVTIKRETEPES